MTSPLLRFALPLLASVALVVPAASGSAAGGSGVILKVKGPGIHHPARFCGKRKSVYVFPKGARLKYKGTVAPAPPKHFPVVVKVERCVGKHFRRVTSLNIVGGRGTGRFKAFFRAPTPGHARVTYFSATAVVAGHRSNKRYFGIRR